MFFWRVVLFLFCIKFLCNAFKFHLSEYPGLRVCRVREKGCATKRYSPYYLAYLRSIYSGCTHVLGNLVLCDLERYENGSDPDLSFLSSIQEVSGYVYLSRNSVRTISLPSLRIIRGEPPFTLDETNASFIATRNGINLTNALEIVSMPNLTAIKQHNVVLRDNPMLCHLAFTVRWEEIFLDKHNQAAIPDRYHDRISQRGCDPEFRQSEEKRIRDKCHGQCAMHHQGGFCWGPGPDSCQKMVKCADGKDRYCQDGPSTKIPCNQECLGGCEGSPNNCRACMSARDGNKCVGQCPPKEIVSRVDSRLQPNPNFKYTFHDICVKDCPAPFLKSNIYCVIECDLKNQIPVNGNCQQCPPSGCPEHCTEEQIFDVKPYVVDDQALDRLKNCIYYTGSIYISKESFEPSKSWKPITDISKLWNLRSLKGMVGNIYMDLRGAPPELKNLTFLDNLENLVWESGETHTPMITILNGEHIELLGFRSLKDIKPPVYLINMTKLCYTSALLRAIPVRMTNVPTEKECAQRDAVCHSECLPEAGCWGPTADMCAHCCNQKAGEFCVSECTDRPGYYEVRRSQSVPLMKHPTGSGTCPTLPTETNLISGLTMDVTNGGRLPPQECSRCHEECQHTCYGPGPHECQGGCKHYQHNDNCVTVCPSTTYVEPGTNRCLPCHSTCLHSIISTEVRLCSGPGDHFGLGGCTACLTVLQKNDARQFQCLLRDCPLKHYIESHVPIDFIRKEQLDVSQETEKLAESKVSAAFMLRVCKPCHPYCEVCSANGTHSSICHNCLHWWFKSECVLQCPPGETYTPKETTTTLSPTPQTTGRMPAVRHVRQVTDPFVVPHANHNESDITPLRLLGPDQRHCLLCHEECVQGCSGPGPTDCAKCRNYMIVLDEDEETFVCNSSCPDDRTHVLHGMCLTAEQYAKLSGRSARETRDRILIGVAVSVLLLVILATVVLVLCLKRKAEAERMREKLRAAYTNLLEPDKDELLKNQSGIREPNMGRLEMINADDLDFDSESTPLGTGAFGVVYRGKWRVPKAALIRHGFRGAAQLDVAIKIIQNDYPITPGCLNQPQPFMDGSVSRDSEDEIRRVTARTNLEELLQEAKVGHELRTFAVVTIRTIQHKNLRTQF
ncbi:Epidermal growth factor receptor [Fasciola hepatica]|uniref:receptor protein-tyrosine kinase n=1 Tax=Fasciola hepatica TaxID=6192 RepID=A0A4E0RH18_FASHE|nr:Epidermal growth factor receptor [Fasciola hepatica]